MAAGLALSLRPAPSPSPPTSTRGPTRRCLAPLPSPRPHLRLAVRPDVACRAATAFQKLDAVAVREEEAALKAAAAAGHDLLPFRRCIFSDHLTPVLAYRCLVREDDREAPSFLFESVEQGSEGTNVGRYSVVGAHPAMEIVAKANQVTVMDHEMKSKKEHDASVPMTVAREIMEQWSPHITDGLPDAFCGGWVGNFSYDTVRYVETKKLPFSKAPEDDRNLPDIHLGLYNDVVVFDHVENKTHVIHWVRLDCYHSIDEAYEDGKNRLEALLSRLHSLNVPTLSSGSIKLNVGQFGSTLQNSSISGENYKKSVVQAKEHILAGDIFQVVLSQRFERRTFAEPFEVYRALRIVNPSPYMAYLQARGCILVASSPEILTRVEKRTIVNRPLAGTIRRGKTKAEDKVLEQLLLSDEKQCAEHIMLVDLGRNDVGKVSKPGTVKVEKLMNVERYSHVMHISSTVTGELRDDLTCWDALRAALPVGTVSGAPKVRAMELIDELEGKMRGPYGGGFGGISFRGDMDIALALSLTGEFSKLLDPSIHPPDDYKWKWFGNALGALDGCRIPVLADVADRGRYRNRHQEITTNMLGVVDWNMKFLYVLPGWEGSASDSRVYKDAMRIDRQDAFVIPQGTRTGGECVQQQDTLVAEESPDVVPPKRQCTGDIILCMMGDIKTTFGDALKTAEPLPMPKEPKVIPPTEILDALQKVPGLDDDDMLMAYGKLIKDERLFEALMTLLVTLSKR